MPSPLRNSISIRTKLIAMVAGALILGVVVIAVFIRGIVYESIVRNKRTTVEILTASMVHDIKYDAEGRSMANVQEIVAKYMTYYRIIESISFYDSDGIARAASQAEAVGHGSDQADVEAALTRAKPRLDVTRPDRSRLAIRSVAPILRGSSIVGAVAIDVSIVDLEQLLSSIDRRIAVILAFVVSATSLLLFFALRSVVLLRLNRLVGVTHEITKGNYSVRVGDGLKDEIGELASAFDRMTDDLRRSQEEIKEHNRTLEKRVSEATAQLQEAYEDLKSAQSQLVLNEKMASLGVLIAGVAHEINTPVGAILNVSRHVETSIIGLPAALGAFRNEPNISVAQVVNCLQEVMAGAMTPTVGSAPAAIRQVEALLREHGVERYRERASVLSKLNFTDQEKLREYIDCFRLPSLFAFVESFGSIAQASRISQSSSQKIAEIVRALKYYAHSNQDRLEPIQVNESIEAALVLLRTYFKNRLTVTTDFAAALPPIVCSSDIHQVWTNLLTNACDAIEEYGSDGAGRITIATRQSGDAVIVTVQDNGCGIQPDKIDRIFDPFVTTKDIGKGTGLGLSIVSGVIAKLNGAVRVRSVPGDTVFEIELPMAESSRGTPRELMAAA